MAEDYAGSITASFRDVAIVFLLALGLRLGWGLSRPVSSGIFQELPDQRDYLSIAHNLLHGRGLSFLDERFDDTVYAFRAPGYSLFLAACGANVRAARAVQAVLDASVVLAIYLLACAVVPAGRRSPTPLVAAAIAAVNPYLIYFSGLLLSETLFTAMLAWGMWLLVIGRSGRGPRRATLLWLGGAVLLALSILVRPSAIALPIFLGLIGAFVNRDPPPAYQLPREERRSGRWPFPVGVTMVALILLCLLPWAVRNRLVLGRWIWTDTGAGFALYDGYNPDATGASDQAFIARQPQLQEMGEVDRGEYLTQKAQAYARSHPARVLDLAAAKLARTWSPMPLSKQFGKPQPRLVALAYSVPLDLLVIAGLLFGRIPRAAKVFLLAPAIYFSMIHALTVGSLRYRIPAEPPMIVIAAAIFAAWGARERRANSD